MANNPPTDSLLPTAIRLNDTGSRLSSMEEGEDDNIGEQDRLLTSERNDIERVRVNPPAYRRRRPWWPIIAFAIASIGTIFLVAWIALSLDFRARPNPSPLEAVLNISLRRPDEDYILDPDWDLQAPSQVRKYDWTIIDKDGDPDGVTKPMVVINGQFPGPLIEVNEGDTIEVNVHNLASNATAIHWHGIFQNGTNWMDGAVGVTQCPIAPETSYTYVFNVAGQSGTYFYHGHHGVQALNGLVGPLVIHSRNEAINRPVPYSSDRVVLLQDWYYDPDSGLMRDVLSPGVEDAPTPNTALINGVNQAECLSHPGRTCSEEERLLPRLDLDTGVGHRLRFINVGAFAWFQVAVDEHDPLPIIEVDATGVEPNYQPAVIVAPGQRYSVVLTANKPEKDAFWLRARMIVSCFASQILPEDGISEARAIVRYRTDATEDNENDPLSQPTTTSNLEYLPVCKDMSSTTVFSPSPAQPAPESADHSWYLRVNLAIGDWRLQRGVLNGSSFRPDPKSPTLHRVLAGLANDDDDFARPGILDAASGLVISHTGAADVVDVVLQNMDENSHPFHLHGAQVWLLAAGHGYFPGYAALGLRDGNGNASVVRNPLRRDTVTAEGFGWVVLRFVADNPGMWLFHCHVLWHSEAGMGMQFLARPDAMRGWEIPEDARKLCEAPEEELRKGASPEDEEFYGIGDGDGDGKEKGR